LGLARLDTAGGEGTAAPFREQLVPGDVLGEAALPRERSGGEDALPRERSGGEDALRGLTDPYGRELQVHC
jgi:hypothetical protein